MKFLLDTNVISEVRKGAKADSNLIAFWETIADEDVFIPVQAVGEVRFGIEILRRRNDLPQALLLEEWLKSLLHQYAKQILSFDLPCAISWGCLPHTNTQHVVDKQIAAIAQVYDLTVVTRNTDDFAGTGVRLLNPFLAAAPAAPSLS